MAQNDNQNNKNNNNNFFNQNPLLVFAIFSLVIIVIFKNIMNTDRMGQDSSFAPSSNSVTKNINYYEFKELIKQGKLNYVAIGQATIKAYSQNGGFKTIYITKKVGEDTSLIPLLESKKIPYGGYNETNIFMEMLFSWVMPVFIFFGIWMLLASRMQKSMGGGILGMGSSKKLVNSEKPK